VIRRHVARLSPPLTTLVCAIALWGGSLAAAEQGLFAGFSGRWSGTGTIRVKSADKNTAERVRCTATYRPRGTTAVDLQLACRSDSYNFDLSGEFEADASGKVTGRWTEHSRNVGGTAIGTARGEALQLHVESSAFAANLTLTTRGQQQSINLDSHGTGQTVTASMTLRRN
jgi:hypothetical protein